MDKSCPPCQDFHRYANGRFLDANPVPPQYSTWGRIEAMAQSNREKLRVILEQAAANRSAPKGSPEERIGAFYAACMDTARQDALGLQPLAPEIKRIAAVRDRAGLSAAILRLSQLGVSAPILMAARQDRKNPAEVIADFDGLGLSLSDRDDYFRKDERSASVRAALVDYIVRAFRLMGIDAATSEARARAVFHLETAFAGAMLTRVQLRDPYARYHRMELRALEQIAPGFDWGRFGRAARLKPGSAVNVAQPEFFKAFDRELRNTPLDVWKAYLTWRLVDSFASSLGKAFAAEHFRFRDGVLRGTREMPPQWQRCVVQTDQVLGEALGQVYVARHFPPEGKRKVLELVENLRAALDEELASSKWLSETTRAAARAKLKAFTPKIGYPERWRDYSRVKVDRRSLVRSLISAAEAEWARTTAKIGRPVDRLEWRMSPPTVNAYYSPLGNEIVFPAGILQPPMFSLDAGDAQNYGAIGSVIGHEMVHGFDDEGSKFSASGALENWWTAGDRRKFEERAACVAGQFDSFDVDGLRHNGKLVTGEAMGDLGGLTIAYRAYRRSLRGKPEPPVVDGLTGDQRFFLAFAQLWGRNHRPEALRLRLLTDPHPIAKYRANGTLQNMPEFHRAFGCKRGDPMVRPPEQTCRLW